MPARTIGFASDIDKARFIARSAQEKAKSLGAFVEDDLSDTTGIEAGQSSGWAHDTVEKLVAPSGAAMATVVSIKWSFAQNVANLVTAVWESEGTIRIYFSRNDGTTWIQMANGAATAITGAAGKDVRLKAEIEVGAKLKGWSACW